MLLYGAWIMQLNIQTIFHTEYNGKLTRWNPTVWNSIQIWFKFRNIFKVCLFNYFANDVFLFDFIMQYVFVAREKLIRHVRYFQGRTKSRKNNLNKTLQTPSSVSLRTEIKRMMSELIHTGTKSGESSESLCSLDTPQPGYVFVEIKNENLLDLL